MDTCSGSIPKSNLSYKTFCNAELLVVKNESKLGQVTRNFAMPVYKAVCGIKNVLARGGSIRCTHGNPLQLGLTAILYRVFILGTSCMTTPTGHKI